MAQNPNKRTLSRNTSDGGRPMHNRSFDYSCVPPPMNCVFPYLPFHNIPRPDWPSMPGPANVSIPSPHPFLPKIFQDSNSPRSFGAQASTFQPNMPSNWNDHRVYPVQNPMPNHWMPGMMPPPMHTGPPLPSIQRSSYSPAQFADLKARREDLVKPSLRRLALTSKEVKSSTASSSTMSSNDSYEKNRKEKPLASEKPAVDETPKRKRKKSKKNKEIEYTSKARTLGELALETVKMKPEASAIKDESSSEDELKLECKQTNEEERKNHREYVPRIKAEDYDNFKEEYKIDPEEFDQTKLHIEVDNNALPILDCSKYYSKIPNGSGVMSTNVHSCMLTRFENDVLGFLKSMRKRQPTRARAPTPSFHKNCKCGHDSDNNSNESSSSSEEEDGTYIDVDDDRELTDEQIGAMKERYRVTALLRREIQRKIHHPAAMSPDISFNEAGLTNDGPSCRCSPRAREEGLRHNIYPGETRIPDCIASQSNSSALHHYVLRVKRIGEETIGCGRPSSIISGGVFYDLEGFSVFFHQPLPELMPAMPIAKWTQEFEFKFVKESFPEAFTVGDLEAFHTYLFDHVLELYDHLNVRRPKGVTDGCPIYHIMPRYVANDRATAEKKLLPMSEVMKYLFDTFGPMIKQKEAEMIPTMTDDEFNRKYLYQHRGQLVMNPEKKPSTIRVDGLSRTPGQAYPNVVHYATRPLAYVTRANPLLRTHQRRLMKLMHERREKGHSEKINKEVDLTKGMIEKLKLESQKQRATQFISSAEDFFTTGFNSDIVTHSLILILAVQHVRLHWSLSEFEKCISYKFKNRALLELALTHPTNTNRQSYGTNHDHAKTVLANCGTRRRGKQLDEYREKKRGIHNLINTMAKSGVSTTDTTQPMSTDNERLEFLGDAVLEIIVTQRLFFILPHHYEGGLASYRSSLVQNRNLASLARKLRLHEWLMYNHGSELCHEAEFKHALANTFEALLAAIYLDGNLEECDRLFSETMWGDDPRTKILWDRLPKHELQRGKETDRDMIAGVPVLEKLTKFEDMTGIKFNHIRLLAKAFTRRCIPHNNLTLGNNQRLEWLGDAVLQFYVSVYLYKRFPNHQEGHLSLLRSCIVSNKTQAAICDELCIPDYMIRQPGRDQELKLKDKADLMEALIGAIFVDQGWLRPKILIQVAYLPRLKYFINESKWNDPKSKLQQSCLALREQDSHPPQIPVYRKISVIGPSNTRIYQVAVYFRNKRLSVGEGSTVHQAEMAAAENALKENTELFPSLKKKTYKRSHSAITSAPEPRPSTARSIPSLLSISVPSFPAYGIPSRLNLTQSLSSTAPPTRSGFVHNPASHGRYVPEPRPPLFPPPPPPPLLNPAIFGPYVPLPFPPSPPPPPPPPSM